MSDKQLLLNALTETLSKFIKDKDPDGFKALRGIEAKGAHEKTNPMIEELDAFVEKYMTGPVYEYLTYDERIMLIQGTLVFAASNLNNKRKNPSASAVFALSFINDVFERTSS